MARIANIKLATVSSDPGPYNLYTITSASVTTLVVSNVSQTTLTTTGYNLLVENNIANIKIMSINPTCDSKALILAVPAP